MKNLPSIFAWLTLISALPLISMGAVVTTVDAGMAFPDWPTSDGYSMLAYPWLQSIGEPDKFLEHGHRLAGMLTGFCTSIMWFSFSDTTTTGCSHPGNTGFNAGDCPGIAGRDACQSGE